jgi:alginate O-acetyltransferase complex protein AlgI
MPFNSYQFFFVFLPVVAAGWWWCSGTAKAKWWLLGANIAFLLFWDYRYVPLLAAVIFLTWLVARRMLDGAGDGRRWCLLGLGWLAISWACFKYLSVVVADSATASADVGARVSMMPLGISFVTFNLASLLMDISRRRVIRGVTLRECFSFATCFPYVMAGPLVRWNDVQPGLQGAAPARRDQVVRGFFLISIGLGKKVLVADPIGMRLNHLLTFGDGGMVGTWLAMSAFAAQIYFDFSGYSDMAVGGGSLMGFDLPQNFSLPYRATNPADFWRRWHMSLSAWVRDYVYLSLGLGRSRARAIFNTFVAMLLIGLWHGVAWTFLLWGVYHACLLSIYHVSQTIGYTRSMRVPPLVSRIVMFGAVTVGWSLFRADSLSTSAQLLAGMAGMDGPGNVREVLNHAGRTTPVLVLFALAITQLLPEPYAVRVTPAPWLAVALGTLFAVSLMSASGSNPFLYLQF